jgi:hypothetical protein
MEIDLDVRIFEIPDDECALKRTFFRSDKEVV